MKIELRELGALKHCEIDINDFTIISGANNSGKTYVSYTVCGFLLLWRQFVTFSKYRVEIFKSLTRTGEAHISTDDLIDITKKIIKEGCADYSKALHKVLAGSAKHLENSYFNITPNDVQQFKKTPFERTATRSKQSLVRVSYEGGEAPIKISILSDINELSDPAETTKIALDFLNRVLQEQILQPLFPEVFIASAERTGATIFQKELDLARNRLIEKIGDTSNTNDIDLFALAFQISTDYALPVKEDIDFIRSIESFSKDESEISKAHPGILHDFHDIIGGEYKFIKNQGMHFIPKDGKKGVKLTMGESSSAVRSLLNIGSYIRHKAKPGDLLIIDEPELNLHPLNQRKVARLLARLVNTGVNVFITTHSDYLIKELNTLIMLSTNSPQFEKIRIDEGYTQDELLLPSKLHVYQAAIGQCKYEGMARNAKGMTLIPASIDPEQGIWIESFDDQIEEMDRIQSRILYSNE